MKRILTLALMLIAFYSHESFAQISTPAASPSSTVKQTVGLTEVVVEYSRPSMKGRTIFGEDALVPYGKIWRTGANQATKITFSDDVKIEGKELKAGSYAILTVPGSSSWDVNFYTYESSGFGSYVEKEPTVSVNVPTVMLPFEMETFSILFGSLKNESGTINIVWDDMMVVLNLGVDVDSKVMAAIDKTLAGPTVGDYYAAGAYYHDSGKDLEKALKWVQKATMTDSPRYWQVRKEALILADLKRYKEAVKAAEKSLKLATDAGNDDYVRMNKKSIEMWMKK